jgi:predicted PurR-regulated permease PerM
MNQLDPSDDATGSAGPVRLAANTLCATAILLLLYLGREILVPITLALILSLALAPLVRVFRRRALSQGAAVLLSVALVCAVLAGIALALGAQLISLGQRLPQYSQTLHDKLQSVQTATIDRLRMVQGEMGQVAGQAALKQDASDPDSTAGAVNRQGDGRPLQVEMHQPAPTPAALMSRLVSSVWVPLGPMAIVLITMIFALLEHATLRDRFIRLAGVSDLRGTTHALDDAGQRLSRYFISQLSVNACTGAIVGVGLILVGLPQALLWAALTVLLRFVPYVGVLLAAVSAALLGAAVDPGWTLCLETVAVFATVELGVAYVVEPLLYGHSTGMSPMTVVLAAIFWSWIWGPIGLLMSTPLTLCLVVAGRNVKGLAFLDILLGDTPALTLSQRLYQRGLTGDTHELLADARAFLGRKSLARYCDEVLMPALEMAEADFVAGSISPAQQGHLRNAVIALLQMVDSQGPRGRRVKPGKTVLDQSASVGLALRLQREALLGRWQGPGRVAARSVFLCVGFGSLRDDMLTEVLVRVLRDLKMDARSVSAAEPVDHPADSTPEDVAMVFIVGFDGPAPNADQAASIGMFRSSLPGVPMVAVVPGVHAHDGTVLRQDAIDALVTSFEEAVAHAEAVVRRRSDSE